MLDSHINGRIRRALVNLTYRGDRHPGTDRNRAATRYVRARMQEAGLKTEALDFEVPEWRYGAASLSVGDTSFRAHPGPFSAGVQAEGPLRVVRTFDELDGLDASGTVLLLCDAIASEQFTPRGYPFYSEPSHATALDALEAARPLAIVAATDTCAMTAAMSPFPLIEEMGFGVPHAYLHASVGTQLAEHAGELMRVAIDSETLPSTGVQPVGHKPGTDPGAGTVVVSAHIDTKPDTFGGIDNTAGVAVLLAVADLLCDREVAPTVEFVPFNGEDHAQAPGELAYLAARPDLSAVRLALNIDAAGLPDGPTAYSGYGIDAKTEALAAALAEEFPGVAAGPQWFASDHMVFAMRGVPAMAFTSMDFEAIMRDYAHTPADAPSILDTALLAETAHYIAELIARM